MVGRFAPTPSGRMHLGNVFSALMAWLSVRSEGGTMLLRMEDLDPERTRPEYAEGIRRDLDWLGLDWDRETPPQSTRTAVYNGYFERLRDMGLLYPCYCTRSRLHASDAPHGSDGQYVYDGRCRNLTEAERAAFHRLPSWRVRVPDRVYSLRDRVYGTYSENLQKACGDFIVRRADGIHVYQLAVVVDDGDSGVTQVVRGQDLLSSAPRQMYLQDLWGFPHPEYAHVPMLVSADGRRLSKRDGDLDLEALRHKVSAEKIVGALAYAAGLIPEEAPMAARDLVPLFSLDKLPQEPIAIGNFIESQ